MSAPYNQVKRKAEDALKAFIESKLGKHSKGTQVLAGLDQTEKKIPRIEIFCTVATAEVIADDVTGNWFIETSIAVITNYKETTRKARTLLESEVFDIILDDQLVEELNQRVEVSDFTVYGGENGAGEGIGFEPTDITTLINGDHEIKEEMTGILYGRPSLEEST